MSVKVQVQIEHQTETLGIGTDRPRLSWRVETDTRDWRQAAYEIESYDAEGNLHSQTSVESEESQLVAWSLAPLASRQRLSVCVRVRGEDGQLSAWSERVAVEAGLL